MVLLLYQIQEEGVKAETTAAPALMASAAAPKIFTGLTILVVVVVDSLCVGLQLQVDTNL